MGLFTEKVLVAKVVKVKVAKVPKSPGLEAIMIRGLLSTADGTWCQCQSCRVFRKKSPHGPCLCMACFPPVYCNELNLEKSQSTVTAAPLPVSRL